MKLHFATGKKDAFAQDLQSVSNRYIRRYNLIPRAKKILWLKLIFYSLCFCLSYLWLVTDVTPAFSKLILQYILLGFSGLLLAFNAAHDAVHSTFSKRREINRMIYTLTFNLQGLSGYLWRIRHLASHHVFPNVDGCDADIDDNPFIRLSPHQSGSAWHRYQHIYATLLYTVYTLHWMLFKDVHYMIKKDLANLRNLRHTPEAIAQVFLWKAFYFTYIIVLPTILIDCPFLWIIAGFLVMHGVLSVFFVLTLIISHLCEETEFPLADEHGTLPFNYHQHQLAVSLDYHPRSYLANWIFGGFNAHAAHHLFPRMPHTCYPQLTKIIQRVSKANGYPYNELSIPKAVRSHYRFLKRVGQL